MMCSDDEQGLQMRSFAYSAEHPNDIPADFPNPETVFVLHDDFQSRKGRFLRSLDCSSIRYSLLLTFNEEVSDCLENNLLEKMYQAFEEEDLDVHRSSLCLASGAFMTLFWPYLLHDVKLRLKNGTLMDQIDPLEFENQDWHKLQLKTVDGSIRAIEHNVVPDSRYCSFTNPYPDLRCVPRNEIELVEKASYIVYKVRVEGQEYALKATASQGMRVVEKFHGTQQHPNVLGLSGVAVNAEGKINGLLTPFISGTLLSCITSATTSQKTKWKAKITDAVDFLHKQHIVWGDAKSDNIIVSKDSDEPVLINFEGGYSYGWVDRELCDTMEGDLQALPRLHKTVDDIARKEV